VQRVVAPARLLVDAGPLIALFNRRDRWHREARAFFGTFRGVLITTWPALTEAAHFIGRRVPELLDLVEAGRIQIAETAGAASRIASLLRTYADLPMDLADATLVAAAEASGLSDVLTRDRHFHAYRIRGRARFAVWPLTAQSV
jgi:predicted nucleic acid-binding protein